jgi:pimeloyl-ACP methyl ester carboxylesterase
MTTKEHIRRPGHYRRLSLVLASALALGVGAIGFASAGSAAPRTTVTTWTIHYTAHDGANRLAYVLLPSWYGPKRNPSIPVIISPHGRNANGLSNSKYFGTLPAVGRFAVISPDGMGRRLALKSYAYRGQIDDLAKMPDFAERELPWLRLDFSRVYALGSSMGGHETLMLVARHPSLLAGAVAMDSVTDLPRRYDELPNTACDQVCLQHWGKPYGLVLQAAMRTEVGGTPTERPKAYAERSPLAFAREIAGSGVPLQIWWSTEDRIVTDQEHQSGALFQALRQLGPHAPLTAYVGAWPHSREMRASQLLPIALKQLGLLPTCTKRLPNSVQVVDVAKGV